MSLVQAYRGANRALRAIHANGKSAYEPMVILRFAGGYEYFLLASAIAVLEIKTSDIVTIVDLPKGGF